MRAGQLRERVQLQAFTAASDSYGQPIESWAELATVWGDVKPLASREGFTPGAGQVQATATHKVRIRYRADLDEKMRVIWRTRVLQVEAVQDPDQRTRETVLMCLEIAGVRVEVEAPAPEPAPEPDAAAMLDFGEADNSMYLGLF
jgi:SPP1 family predicted phage head-tail adaptor